MVEQIDDLLAQIPAGWDVTIGTDWNGDTGADECLAVLRRRALGDYLHLGHHLVEIEKEAPTLRGALEAAVADAREWEIKNPSART